MLARSQEAKESLEDAGWNAIGALRLLFEWFRIDRSKTQTAEALAAQHQRWFAGLSSSSSSSNAATNRTLSTTTAAKVKAAVMTPEERAELLADEATALAAIYEENKVCPDLKLESPPHPPVRLLRIDLQTPPELLKRLRALVGGGGGGGAGTSATFGSSSSSSVSQQNKGG